MAGVQIRGAVAQVYWGYHVAAALHGFTVRRDKATGLFHLRANVITSDAFRMRQEPLSFVIPVDKGQPWKWNVDSFAIDRGTITAVLSLPRSGNHGALSSGGTEKHPFAIK